MTTTTKAKAVKAAPVDIATVEAATASRLKAERKAAKAAKKAKKAAREARMESLRINKTDAQAVIDHGPSIDVLINDYLAALNGARVKGRTLAVRLNVLFAVPGVNAHWTMTTNKAVEEKVEAFRKRFYKAYTADKKANGEGAGSGVRSVWKVIREYAQQAAGVTADSRTTGTGNKKAFKDYALDTATTAFIRGTRLAPTGAKEKKAIELYGEIIKYLAGDKDALGPLIVKAHALRPGDEGYVKPKPVKKTS